VAFTIQLIEGSLDPINLFYAADDQWSMLEKGFQPNDPELRQLWGGYLEKMLVRQEYGRREIPLKLMGEWSTVDELIEAVNALQERLDHAARYHAEGWGDEVFLRVQLHNATYAVDFPVSSGQIDKAELFNACSMPMDGTGHREAKRLLSVGVLIQCGDSFWESPSTYTLENYVANPGFWRGATAPGDNWTEDDVGAVLTLAWDTTIYEVMGRSLKWTIGADAVNYPGIHQDVAVAASTNYYFEVRGYHTAGCDRITAYLWDLIGAAVIPGTILYFDNQDDAWEKLGAAFTTPVGCTSLRIVMNRSAADSSPGNKTFYCDAFYIEPRTDAPVGWSSGRALKNRLDSTAGNINVLCVTEIPGEVGAETTITCNPAQSFTLEYIAKRTRDDPYGFIWELLGADAFVTATDANCIDSVLAADATAPGGQRVTVNFATDQTMKLRCYWRIAADRHYKGSYQVYILANKSASTDMVTMRVRARSWYPTSVLFDQGYTQTVKMIYQWPSWSPYGDWCVFSFPCGVRDDDTWLATDYWYIMVYAAIAGAAAWDNLYIAGALLVPVDEAFAIAGNEAYQFNSTYDFYWKNMDGDRGFFTTTASKRTNNLGYVGTLVTLEPKVENWLYFLQNQTSLETYINDAMTVSLTYRPRGKFLRGANP
jgi:hypothetical protein